MDSLVGASPTPQLRVRVNVIDHVMAEPGSLDDPGGNTQGISARARKVPIIRIFGDSSTGHKACVHVHQVWPYFYVEYTGSLKPESVNRYISRLHFALNAAIAMSMNRDHHDAIGQFVRSIILVKGIPFYGFHSGYSPFLKILLTNPDQISRAILILQSGSVMGRKMNAFESHLSYPLQFMCDFNLYGCGWIDLKEVHYRREIDQDEESIGTPLYHPVTTMPIELDVIPYHILNRAKVEPRHIHHKLQVPILEEAGEPLVSSVRELWEDEKRRRQEKGLNPTPELPSVNPAGGRHPWANWAEEERFKEAIKERLEKEREEEAPVKSNAWEPWVMTTYESIQALWDRPFRTWQPSTTRQDDGLNPYTQSSDTLDRDGEKTDVDERLLSSQAFGDEVNRVHEEDEWQRWHDQQEAPVGQYEEENDPEQGPRPELVWETPVKLPHLSAENHDRLFAPESEPSRNGHHIANSPSPQSADGELYSEREQTPVPKFRPISAPASTGSQTTHANGMHTTSLGLGIVTTEDEQRYAMNEFDHGDAGGDPQDPIPALSLPSLNPNKRNGTSSTQPSEVDDLFFTPKSNQTEDRHNEPDSPGLLEYEETEIARIIPSPSPMVGEEPISGSSVKFDLAPAHNGEQERSYSAYEYNPPPPSRQALLSSLEQLGIPLKIYRDPYYSNPEDVPDQGREFGGLYFELQGGHGYGPLKEWAEDINEVGPATSKPRDAGSVFGWEFASMPPSRKEVVEWLFEMKNQEYSQRQRRKKQSQIEGPTQRGSFVPRYRKPAKSEVQEFQSMSIMSLEVFAPTDNAAYDPETDEIAGLFWCLHDGDYSEIEGDRRSRYHSGILVLDSIAFDPKRLRDHHLETFSTEMDLINFMIDEVRDLDPDVLAGWEVQSNSWGYLINRGKSYGVDIRDLLGRAPSKHRATFSDNWSTRHTSHVKVTGRHVLNLWRLMRSELTLDVYTFHHVVRHVLKQRTPKYSNATLKEWFESGTPAQTSRMLSYFADMTCMVLEILDETQVVTKTAEFARVFGIDFFSVLSRGSQFKVESFMLRIAKPESFVLISPTRSQVGKQNALECGPLIMEPMSAFYKSPLLVLDFQSLYPSVMVAYNYCYSTCLGRTKDFQGKNRFGMFDHLEIPVGTLEKVRDHINVAPNGMIYVKPTVRKSLLAKMLTELLDTRVMVKEGMKLAKGNKPLLRVLDARQLSLKFICNVTYGYTSATFSGRMPAVELADSIVQTGRETLENAIKMIETTPRWGAKVVYGDTDSLFVYLPGKTKDQAFIIGEQIANAVTAANPAPVRLKFEKVYLPSVLVAKKRYVGFKYEHPDQAEPVFDAKGIETVRRDGIPAGQKMLEAAIKILFRSQDLSEVKSFCWRTWTKVLEGRVSIQDFIFAPEVRLGTYSDKGPPPPGAAVAVARLADDPNDEAQYGERVRYVVTRAGPGDQLRHRAMAPEKLLFDETGRQLDAMYYVTRRLIPPLSRIFNLVGADVQAWFDEMPKVQKVEAYAAEGRARSNPSTPQKTAGKSSSRNQKIDHVLASGSCLVCDGTTTEVICHECSINPESAIFELMSRLQLAQKRARECQVICASCSGSSPDEHIPCESLDCEWLYERVKAKKDLQKWGEVPELIAETLTKDPEDD